MFRRLTIENILPMALYRKSSKNSGDDFPAESSSVQAEVLQAPALTVDAPPSFLEKPEPPPVDDDVPF